MNHTHQIAHEGPVEWYADELAELPNIWSLKLYAFQPLWNTVMGFDPKAHPRSVSREFDDWIADWIETVSIGNAGFLRRAWTPWSVSLRVQHWIRYLAWRDRIERNRHARFEIELRRELYKNVLFLRNHVEYDVDGNHLIENGAALAVAGIVFEHGDHDWLEAGLSILENAAAEQFLHDGCHYERSPMYHVLVLTRLLSVRHLLERSSRTVPKRLETTTDEATAFLRTLRPPDGRIPLLNDSVYGEAIPIDACLRYAEHVGVDDWESRGADRAESIETDPTNRSGYHWLQAGDASILIDGGAVGPPHLPGHAHSDTLNVLLWIGTDPVVTDTGTFGYTSGSRRTYARGVCGHNTVQVGSSEPIGVAGKYLMGPRFIPRTRIERGAVSMFEGSYKTSPLWGAEYNHHRTVYAGDGWILLRDAVSGDRSGTVRSRLHLHPDVSLSIDGGVARVDTAHNSVSIRPLGRARLEAARSEYFPQFGHAVDRPVLELTTGEKPPANIDVAFLCGREPDDVSIDDHGGHNPRFRMGNDEHLLAAPELRFDR